MKFTHPQYLQEHVSSDVHVPMYVHVSKSVRYQTCVSPYMYIKHGPVQVPHNYFVSSYLRDYELYAVITHTGMTLSQGHYVAFIKADQLISGRRHDSQSSSDAATGEAVTCDAAKGDVATDDATEKSKLLRQNVPKSKSLGDIEMQTKSSVTESPSAPSYGENEESKLLWNSDLLRHNTWFIHVIRFAYQAYSETNF